MILSLFATFFFIGAFSFGGGYAMLPLIQKEVVYNHTWLTMQEFSDIIAIAEITPGPVAINTATFVGYKTAGVAGSAAATLGVVLPSFIIIVLLAGLILKYKDNVYLKGAFSGLRPVVVALILGAALLIGRDTLSGGREILLTLIALLIMRKTSLHPVFIILIFGGVGVIFL